MLWSLQELGDSRPTRSSRAKILWRDVGRREQAAEGASEDGLAERVGAGGLTASRCQPDLAEAWRHIALALGTRAGISPPVAP